MSTTPGQQRRGHTLLELLVALTAIVLVVVLAGPVAPTRVRAAAGRGVDEYRARIVAARTGRTTPTVPALRPMGASLSYVAVQPTGRVLRDRSASQ